VITLISEQKMGIKTIMKFFDLTLTHSFATIKSEAKQTFIGYLWWLLDPLMFIGVYYLVFGLILGSKTDNFVAFLLIGILSFQWFQNSVSQGAASIYNGGGLLKQIRINKALFPLSKILHNAWQFLFVIAIYSIFGVLFLDLAISIQIFVLPIILFIQALITTGLTFILAAFYPFFPDIKHVLQPTLRALLFLSGVFFSADKVPDHLEFYFYLNPMATLIEAYRDVLLRQSWPDSSALLSLSLVSIILIAIGTQLIKRYSSSYAKVIP